MDPFAFGWNLFLNLFWSFLQKDSFSPIFLALLEACDDDDTDIAGGAHHSTE